jgi:hypothetical protein
MKIRPPTTNAPEQEIPMRWYHDVSYFFGAAILANFIPHVANGLSGSPFQSPFASPPGEGLSSSTVNALWAMVNLFFAYLLLVRVGTFDIKSWRNVGVFAAGFGIMSLLLARSFGRFHGGML